MVSSRRFSSLIRTPVAAPAHAVTNGPTSAGATWYAHCTQLLVFASRYEIE